MTGLLSLTLSWPGYFYSFAMEKLRKIVKGNTFNIITEVLIVISLVTFPFETIIGLPSWIEKLLYYTELTIIILFTVEYILRIVVSKRPIKHIFSLNGIVDLLAFFPYYVIGADFRAIRIFRLFRLFRILNGTVYSDTLRDFKKAFVLIKNELVVFFMLSLSLLYISAVVIYYFENSAQPEMFSSMFDGIWWSIITLTTTGYGDLYPITIMGKIFTTLMLITGVGIVIIPSSLFAASFHKVNKTHINH